MSANRKSLTIKKYYVMYFFLGLLQFAALCTICNKLELTKVKKGKTPHPPLTLPPHPSSHNNLCQICVINVQFLFFLFFIL